MKWSAPQKSKTILISKELTRPDRLSVTMYWPAHSEVGVSVISPIDASIAMFAFVKGASATRLYCIEVFTPTGRISKAGSWLARMEL